MKPEYIAFLKELGVANLVHERGSLYEHLTGTYKLLASWGCEEHVCAAGLFHSIYGTGIYRHKTISYDERPFLRKFLGEKAEDLVYLFSTVDRPTGLISAIRSGYMTETASKRKIYISSECLRELIEIETANLLEQGGEKIFFEKLLSEAFSANFELSGAVLNAAGKMRF